MYSQASALLTSILLACAFIHSSATTTAHCIVSSNDGIYKLTNYTAPVLGTNSNSGISSSWSLTVDDTSTGLLQSVTGFGAAVTDATVTVFNELTASQQKAFLEDVFGTTEGVKFNLMRHTIGASDLSSYVYSYDNVSVADPDLKYFDLEEPGVAMAKLIAKMVHVNEDIKLLGSVWSPPGWMKLNHVEVGTTVNNNLNASYSTPFADYFVKYIQAFEAHGVSVDAITIQNEPLNSNAGYPTNYVAADQSTTLIQDYVGPALAAAGIDTEIWAYDHNTDVPSYPQTVLDGASDYIDTVAWHCYATDVDWTVLSDFHTANPGVTQYMTECWTSPENSWYNTIDVIMGPMTNYSSGAILWTLATDTSYSPHLPGGCTTCRGLIEVDTSTGTYSKTLDFYFIGQFSKFVQRGSTALGTTGGYDYGNGAKIEIAAFLNKDGSRTLVIQNGFGNAVELTVTFEGGDVWSGPLYQESLTTWLLPASSACSDGELGRLRFGC